MYDRCVECHRTLPAYVAGELPALELEAVRRHVESCSRCRAEAMQYRHAHNALRAQRAALPPAELTVEIAARLAAHHTRRVPAHRLRLTAASVGALAMIGAAFALTRNAPTAAVQPRQMPAASEVARNRPAADSSNRPGAVALTDRRSSPDAESPASQRSHAVASLSEPSPSVAPAPEGTSTRVGSAHRRGPMARRQAPKAPPAFLDVTDSTGRSARMILAASRAPAAGYQRKDRANRPFQSERNPVIVSQAMHERVQFAGREVQVEGERGWDSRGRLALIRVHVAAAGRPSPSPKSAEPAPAPVP